MIRVLFSVLAVVVAVLAVVLNEPLLYVAAAVLLLVAFLALLSAMRRRHREAQPVYTKPSPEDELKSLGIMDIRPKGPALKASRAGDGLPDEATHPDATASLPPKPVERAGGDIAGGDIEAEKATVASTFAPRQAAASGGPVETVGASVDSPAAFAPAVASTAYDADVLEPYLQALRAAIDARAVCLLKQEDIEPAYDVVMLVSESRTRKGRSFSAREPLLTAGMTHHPVTVRHVGEGGIPTESLGYTRTPDRVRQLAIAPVECPDDPAGYFLVADAIADDALSTPRCRKLMAQFARLLATLMETPDAAPEQDVRPRREIIAEEMEAARNEERSLALALVYLNRAEAVADEGEGAVRAAERLMEARLREAVDGRIERFGELTFGIFYHGEDVEAWGGTIQHAFLGMNGPLEGGVSTGIALLEPQHESPQDLRQDATQALSAAFESGSCVILE